MQRQTSRTRGLLLREQHRHGPEGFFFAISIDTTQGQRKPSMTSGLLFCEQPRHDASSRQAFKDQRASFSRAASQEVGYADGLKQRQMCFSRTLCETHVADFLRPASMRYLQVGQRVCVACYMCAVQTSYFVLQVRGRAPVFVCTYM